MKKVFILLALMMGSFSAFSQTNYDQAIGVRLIGGTTISYKNYFANNNIELQVAFWKNGTRIGGLYEFNYPVSGMNGLNFILGPGIHFGRWNNQYKNSNSLKSGSEFGVDGIIGLDYGFPKIPINISIDWQPSIVLAGGSDFAPNLGGIGLRYTF